MSKLLTMTPKQFCKATKACFIGRRFALKQPNMAAVWDNCPRPDWMFWMLDRVRRKPDGRTSRLFAAWCAVNTPMANGRKTGDLLIDRRILDALEVVERYENGTATKRKLEAALARADAHCEGNFALIMAREAAWAAARMASQATRNAECHCSNVSANATASDAAVYASRATAQAAAWAASSGASTAAWKAAQIAQANQLRAMVANPFKAVKKGAK